MVVNYVLLLSQTLYWTVWTLTLVSFYSLLFTTIHCINPVDEFCTSSHRRNNLRDRRPGETGPQLLGLGTNNVFVPEILGRSFQKARYFTASGHQNAGFSI